jgi:hypothetical protein
MKTLFSFFVASTLLLSTQTSFAGGYCLAIRGNGEAEPAHWGAMARTVEQLGVPDAMAGGSSASISMFWLEAMASNRLVLNVPPQMQKPRLSLMIKSMLGLFEEVQKTKTWNKFMNLYGNVSKLESMNLAQKLLLLVNAKKWKEASDVLKQGHELGLISSEYFHHISKALKRFSVKTARFYIAQFKETVTVFGAFNAAGDDNLFFRPGILDFEKLAHTWGRIATFYSARYADEALVQKWQNFFETCADRSVGLSWLDLKKAAPQCSELYHDLFQAHFDNEPRATTAENYAVGYLIPSFATTTVLTGGASEKARAALAEYHVKRDPHYGKDFSIDDGEEVRFGYWGSDEHLAKIERNLDRSDEKSRRFLALGPASWRTVLSISPAEPGLSPLVPFEAKGESYVSAGGWSDLHPIAVLKAYGCRDVVYLTRQGGESLFAQGVAKRLLNLKRDWSILRTVPADAKAENTKINNAGDPSDLSSNWSQLYNLGNPTSSINRSLRAASAILCTDWNAFEVLKQGPAPIMEEAYRSSYFLPGGSRLRGQLSPLLTERRPGCQP